MDNLVTTNPETWGQARWPLPRPSVIRKNADFNDSRNRSFMRVGAKDARALQLRRGHTWWWCALPATSVISGMVKDVPNMHEYIRARTRRYRVVAIGRMIEAKRSVGVYALK